jgi:hypothetical protein
MYNLAARDVHVDALLACGPSSEALPHEAAACAQRIEDQAILNPWPVDLVVLVGDYTARLARNAGLLSASGFLLGKANRRAVTVREWWDVGVDPAWNVLGSAPLQSAPALPSPSAAEPILTALVARRSAGHAWRPIGGEWKRVRSRAGQDEVRDHLAGKGWLSPFLPIGDWPYCVLDVDIHNAIQYAHYDATFSVLRRLFPKSLVFTSSASGGCHFYVRLPPGVAYADAALWLAEYVLSHGLLFHTSTPGRFATAHGTVATRIVEVPVHPPRLPFGLGSSLRGHPEPTQAVAHFGQWLASTDCADFNRAQNFVAQGRRQKRRWPERAAWVRAFMHELELEALGPKTRKPLPPTDPWHPYLPKLSRSLAVLATRGCLAFGTRTGSMVRLADALTELVDPVAAKALLRYWIENRPHSSEDIHSAMDDVLTFGDRCIDEAFAGLGLPEEVWKRAEQKIRTVYANVATGHSPISLTETECGRAAFYVMGLFYQAGRGQIPIAAEQFGLALRDDDIGGLPVRRPNQSRVAEVRTAMTSINLIKMVRSPVPVARVAGEYELEPPFWPPPPAGGSVVYRP